MNSDYKNSSAYDLVFKKSYEQPDATLVISLDKEESSILTYSEFINFTQVLANFLADKNLRKGDVINILMRNSGDMLIIEYAALALGLIVAPINYNLEQDEIVYIIKNSDGKILFTEKEFTPKLSKESEINTIVCDEQTGENTVLQSIINENQAVDINCVSTLDDPALMIYTSGTSGYPKGCILTHRNMLADAKAIAEWFSFSQKTRTQCFLPLFHNNGQIPTFLAPVWAGGSTIMNKFEVAFYSFWDIAHKYKANWSSVIPTMLTILLKLRSPEKTNTIEGIICGGALLPEKVQRQFEEKFDVVVYEGFGLTETTSFATFNPLDKNNRKIGSIGKAMPVNDVGIFDENGNRLSNGEIGEIWIKGDNVFKQYHKLPERNEAAFRDSWFRSGDFGYKDDDGFFFFKGRNDDLIIRGGENIYPREIENVVYKHPEVRGCCVIPIEHKTIGEDLGLFIEPQDNETISRDEIIQFLTGKIAKYKIPNNIYFTNMLDGMPELPKGPTRKIKRKEIIKYYKNNIQKK